jgi:hypothetical protein
MGKIKILFFGLVESVRRSLTSEKAIKVYKGAAIAVSGIVLESLLSSVTGMDIPAEWKTVVAGVLSVLVNVVRKTVV